MEQIPLGVSDKQVARQKLAVIISEREKESEGLIPAASFRKAAAAPLADHFRSFIADRERSGRNWRYLRELQAKLLRMASDCNWQRVADLSAESFRGWRKEHPEMNPKTANEYLIAASGFANWLKKQGLGISNNSFDPVEKVSANGKESFRWQALTDEQVSSLFAVSCTRRPVYILAVHTGLRPGEVRQLEWNDVFLDATKPHLRVRASTTKNGRAATVWLHSEAVEALHFVHASRVDLKDERVFFGIFPKPESVIRDFQKAGISRACRDGHKVGFYSLRHTFCTRLQRAGVPPRIIMELMRHSDMRLTMRTYTDAELLPTAETIFSLPGFGATCNPHSQIHS